jgi:hypothetical protein
MLEVKPIAQIDKSCSGWCDQCRRIVIRTVVERTVCDGRAVVRRPFAEAAVSNRSR